MFRGIVYRLLAFLVFLFISYESGATHLMGGTLTYTRVSSGRYALEFTIYRDCSSGGNAGFDNSFYYSYRGSSSSSFALSRIVYVYDSATISSPIASCATAYCAKKARYRDTLNLGSDANGYEIWYHRDARNYNITNVYSTLASATGMTWYVHIPPTSVTNSSPGLTKDMVPMICKKKNEFNAGYFDPDGDSLVFSIVTPYEGAGSPKSTGCSSCAFTTVSYNSGYTVTKPFGTTAPAIKIDPVSGKITAEPTSTGNYVIAVEVKEYRVDPVTHSATYLGAVRVDLQFIVANCGNNIEPRLTGDTAYTRTVEVGTKFCISVKGEDTAAFNGNYDTLKLTGTGSMLGSSSFPEPYATFEGDTGYKAVSSDFCWTPDCAHITYTSPHLFTIKLEDEGCNVIEKTYSIYVKPRPFVKPPKLQCVDVLDKGMIKISWKPIATDTLFSSYVIYRKKKLETVYTKVRTFTDATQAYWVDSNAKDAYDTTYQYYIRSVNTCDAEGASSDTLTSIVVKRTGLTNQNVSFSWNNINKIYRDSFYVLLDQGSGPFVYDTVKGLTYIMNACTAKTLFGVRLVNDSFSCQSNSGKVSLQDTSVKNTARIINATVNASGKIDVLFEQSNITALRKYYVYRSVNGGAFSVVDTIKLPITYPYTCTDTKSTSITNAYCYDIAAVDSCGTAYRYGSHCVMQLKAGYQNVKTKKVQVDLEWSKYTGHAYDSFYVQKYVSGSWQTITVKKKTDSLVSDNNVTCGTYAYRIMAKELSSPFRITYSDSQSVTVKDTLRPDQPLVDYVNVETNNNIKLKFHTVTDPDTKRYRIYSWTDDVGKTLVSTVWLSNTSPQTYVFTHSGITPYKNRYCYWVAAVDSCGNESAEIRHCAIELKATAGNLQAMLNWRPYKADTVKKYYVERDSGAGFAVIDSVAATDTAFLNKYLKCNADYTYRIKATLTGGTDVVYSDTAKVHITDTVAPDAPVIKVVSVESATSISVTFTSSVDKDLREYWIYGSVDGGPYARVGTVASTGAAAYKYIHTGIDPVKRSYCYYIKAVDTCAGNTSEASVTHCAIQLTGRPGQRESMLSWKKYIGADVEKYYIIQYSGPSTQVKVDSVAATDSLYTNTKDQFCGRPYIYVIAALMKDGSTVAISDTTQIIPFDTVKPAEVNIRSVSVVDDNSINITFDKVPDPDVKNYEIYFSTNGGASYFPATTVMDPATSPFTYKHINLDTRKKRYCYRIYAIDTCGFNKSPSSETHCAIQLSGTAGDTNANLSWTAYEGFPVGQYGVQRFDRNLGWQTVATLSGTAAAYTDHNLACNEHYWYRVFAKPTAGSEISYSDSVGIQPFDTIRPQQVNIRSVSVTGMNNIRITFDQVPDKDVNRYKVYYKKNQGSWTLLTTITNPTAKPVQYDHFGISSETDTFSYKVIAIDSCADNESATSEVHTAVQLIGDEGNYASLLKWNTYTGFAVKNYVVQYFKFPTGWTDLATLGPDDSAYTDLPIPCVNKIYRIKAVENGGDMMSSYSDSIVVKPFDTVKPEPPVIEYVSMTSPDTYHIKWQKSVSNDVRNYNVYRKPNDGVTTTWKSVAALGDVDEYTDAIFSATATSYCYAVKAADSCARNQSDYSLPHCTVDLLADTTLCEQEIDLGWEAYVGWPSVKEYNIYRTIDGGTEAYLATVDGSVLSYIDKPVSNKSTYCYRIEAIPQGPAVFSSYGNLSCGKAYEPTTPEILSASKMITSSASGEIRVKWRSVADQRFYKYYNLYYRPQGGGSFSLLQGNIPVKQDTFIHKNLNTITQDHYYYMEIVDSCGNVSPVSTTHKTMNIDGGVGQLVHWLNWTHYEGWPVDRYVVERLERNAWKKIDSVPGSDTSITIFPAPCNFNIFYRISAVDANGNSAFSDTVGKQALDTIPSNNAKPTNTAVVNGSSITVDFVGADSLDVYKYVIQRADNGSWGTAGEILFTSPADVHRFIDNVNTLNDYFCYTVVTLDSCLNATMTDTFCAVQLKGQPLNQANQLNWHPFVGYDLKEYRLLNLQNNNWDTLATLSPADTSFYHDSLHCYLPYYYKIYGVKTDGSLTTYSDSIQLVPFDTIVPPAATLRYATVQPDHSVKLEWAYDTRSDVKYFEVWRNTNGTGFTKIASLVFDSIYIDNTANPQKEKLEYYVISIDSCNSAHRSVPSDSDKVMRLETNTGACVPLNRLQWNAYSELPEQKDEVRVYRSEDNGANWTVIRTLAPGTTSFTDSTVMVGVWYCYKLEAVDKESGYSSFSDTSCITPWVYPTPDSLFTVYATVVKTGVADGEVYLKWKKYPSSDIFARGYRIYHRDNNMSSFVAVADITDLNTTSYIHKGVNTELSQNSYYIKVFNLCDIEGETDTVHTTIDLKATAGNLKTDLSWNAYAGVDVVQYHIYRGKDGGSMHRLVSLPPVTLSYTDTPQQCLHSYVYQIHAELKGGLISLSDSAGITGKDDTPPPVPDVYFVSVDTTDKAAGKISMNLTGNSEINRSGFKVYRSTNGGTYSLIRTVSDIKKDTLFWEDKGLNTTDDTYSYFFRAIDSCGNESMPSDTHTVVHLNVEAQSLYMQLDWSSYRGWKNWQYLIERRQPGKAWVVIAGTDSTIKTYRDSSVKCHEYYEYRIRSADGGGIWLSFSNMDGDTAFENDLPLVPQIRRASVTATSTTDGKVLVEWNASSSKDVAAYHLLRSEDGFSWTDVVNAYKGYSYTDQLLNTHGKPYLYKVQAIDSCGNNSAGFSDIHKTINLQATSGNQQLRVDWSAYQGWKVKEYNLYRNGQMYASVPGNQRYYVDTMVLCVNYYTYSVEAVADSTVVLTAASNQDSAKPYDNIAPRSVYLIAASVSMPNKVVEISWKNSASFDVKNYFIYRRSAVNGHISFVDSTDQLFYYDTLKSAIATPDCYFVFTRDYCGNMSESSNRGCIIILNGKNGPGFNALSWNDYQEWPDGIQHYNVYKNEDDLGWVKLNSDTGQNFIDDRLTDDVKNYCYQVEAVEKPGESNAVSRSTVICLHQDPIVYIPNVFTPQTTFYMNDKFGPKGMYIRTYKMQIYNRWGQLVFETDKGEEWDGTMQGRAVEDGVYMYYITVYGYNVGQTYHKGTVMILR